MQQVRNGNMGCFIAGVFFALALGIFAGFRGIPFAVSASESKSAQMQDLESEIGNLDGGNSEPGLERQGDLGDELNVAAQMIQLEPRDPEGYEVMYGDLIELGATQEAEKLKSYAKVNGIVVKSSLQGAQK